MTKTWSKHGGKIIFGGTLVIIAIEFLIAWQTKTVNQELAMIIITTVLVATTMYYSLLNDRLLENNQRLLENNQRLLENTNSPEIVLYIRPWKTQVDQHMLVIENVGTGTAFDIKLEVLDNQPFMLSSDLSLMNTSCAEIRAMPPNKDYKILIRSEEWGFEEKATIHTIKVCYANSQNKKTSRDFSLSIEDARDYIPNGLVAEFLKEIASHTKEIANQSPSPQTTDGGGPSVEDLKKREQREKEEMKTNTPSPK